MVIAMLLHLASASLVFALGKENHGFQRCSDAYATLFSKEEYFVGTFALITSVLKYQISPRTVLVLIPRGQDKLRELGSLLETVGATIVFVDSIPNPYRPSVKRFVGSSVMSKLHIFNMTDYNNILFLDSDQLVLQSPDKLFEFEPFAAVQRHGTPHLFWSSCMLIRPSNVDFEKMMDQIGYLESYDGADQGFLNSYFKQLWTAEVRLPQSKHVMPTMMFPAVHVVGKKAHLSDVLRNATIGVHFGGSHHKPWSKFTTKRHGQTFQMFQNLWLQHVQDVLNDSTVAVKDLKQKIGLYLRSRSNKSYPCFSYESTNTKL